MSEFVYEACIGELLTLQLHPIRKDYAFLIIHSKWEIWDFVNFVFLFLAFHNSSYT